LILSEKIQIQLPQQADKHRSINCLTNALRQNRGFADIIKAKNESD
jgi:hypothetical protein